MRLTRGICLLLVAAPARGRWGGKRNVHNP